MPGFPGVDHLLFDSLLSEEELLVRQTACQFADERAIPFMRDAFRDGLFPKCLITEMGELGPFFFLAPIWKATGAPV